MIRSSVSTGLGVARPLLVSAVLLLAGCGSETVDPPKPAEGPPGPPPPTKGKKTKSEANLDSVHPPNKKVRKPCWLRERLEI